MNMDNFMNEWRENEKKCCAKIMQHRELFLKNIYDYFSKDLIEIKPLIGWCFRIYFLKNEEGDLYGLSIANPPDMSWGNIETALLKNGSLIYDELIDYSDIKRFETIDELIQNVEEVFLYYKKDEYKPKSYYKNDIIQCLSLIFGENGICEIIFSKFAKYGDIID